MKSHSLCYAASCQAPVQPPGASSVGAPRVTGPPKLSCSAQQSSSRSSLNGHWTLRINPPQKEGSGSPLSWSCAAVVEQLAFYTVKLIKSFSSSEELTLLSRHSHKFLRCFREPAPAPRGGGFGAGARAGCEKGATAWARRFAEVQNTAKGCCCLLQAHFAFTNGDGAAEDTRRGTTQYSLLRSQARG